MKIHPFLLCLLLAWAALGAVRAEPIIVESPDKNRTWAQGDETGREFVWDAKARKFSLFITYSNVDDAARVSAPETETLSFSFPGVTWDPEQKLFVLALPDGKTVPVAQKVKKLFLVSEIGLLPQNHLEVRSPDGVVKVWLEIRP